MTETPGASSLMGEPAAAIPETPSQAERESAFATLAKLQGGDASFRERFLRRDPAALLEVQSAHRVTNSPTSVVIGSDEGRREQDIAQMIGTMQGFADVPAGVVEQIRTGQPVSAEEQKWAQQSKGRLMTDREWARR